MGGLVSKNVSSIKCYFVLPEFPWLPCSMIFVALFSEILGLECWECFWCLLPLAGSLCGSHDNDNSHTKEDTLTTPLCLYRLPLQPFHHTDEPYSLHIWSRQAVRLLNSWTFELVIISPSPNTCPGSVWLDASGIFISWQQGLKVCQTDDVSLYYYLLLHFLSRWRPAIWSSVILWLVSQFCLVPTASYWDGMMKQISKRKRKRLLVPERWWRPSDVTKTFLKVFRPALRCIRRWSILRATRHVLTGEWKCKSTQ